MNRRAFLAALSAAALARGANAAFASVAPPRKKVVIVGGGLAGLSCAYELRKYNFDVVLLEGQGRAGGRVQTLREGLYQGLSAETGATRIPDTHELTLSYVREFGLTLEPFRSGDFADVVHLRGKNYVGGHNPEPDWPLQLTAEERRLGRKGLAQRYMAGPLQSLVKGDENSLNVPKAILEQDNATLGDYLKKQGLSPDAIELLTVGGDTTVSAGLLFLVELNEQISRQYFHIAGGNDLLPAALANQLGGAVRYGCKAVSIGQDDGGAWVVIENAEGHETVRGDLLVTTLPFSVSRNLFSDARIPEDKQRAIRELKYFAVDKIFLQMRSQFWKKNGQSGFANTDLLSERFWSLGPEHADQRGLLLSYVIGNKAAKLDQMDMQSRIKQTLADAESVFPGADEHFEGARTKSWGQDPWQLGAFPAFAPGQLSSIPLNARREGRIFFAGEHTSRYNGWMQGAIESAHRVVKEIRA
ncbi:FAD-dependent oxidoreductase [Granulicella sp. dw_53]|uniref:flavin monoamine oxidase family protein n=1 Tax=Granulicella sp. dw_53 TaxID=2719792 RepID=UPI001BD66D9F|nr:FAD-dependent oxidoreductase [Granulicella sp. dw_53]